VRGFVATRPMTAQPKQYLGNCFRGNTIYVSNKIASPPAFAVSTPESKCARRAAPRQHTVPPPPLPIHHKCGAICLGCCDDRRYAHLLFVVIFTKVALGGRWLCFQELRWWPARTHTHTRQRGKQINSKMR